MDISAKIKVADFVDTNGYWKWSELNNYFTRETLERIATCHPHNDALGDDSAYGNRIRR